MHRHTELFLLCSSAQVIAYDTGCDCLSGFLGGNDRNRKCCKYASVQRTSFQPANNRTRSDPDFSGAAEYMINALSDPSELDKQ